MAETDLAKKLLLKPGTSFLLLNAPESYGEGVAAASENVSRATEPGDEQYDLVQLFVRSREEFERWIQPAISSVRSGGILWVTYPKQSGGIKSDLNRNRVAEAMGPTGWRPVTQISIDETWSALRMRPESEVGR